MNMSMYVCVECVTVYVCVSVCVSKCVNVCCVNECECVNVCVECGML